MEELRKHKTLQNAAHHIGLDCLHPQTSHGSPYHVHPYPSPVRLQHAFQPSHNSSNMFHPKGLSKAQVDATGLWSNGTPNNSPLLGRALCLTPRGSPIPGRVSRLSDKFQDCVTLSSDTDALVTKIGAMFPTVSETHIKILLKKYYNREAVVISALQVEKHPITTPGPLSMSPSVSRLQKSAVGVYSALQLAKGFSGSTQMTPLTGSPHGSPSLLRPASGASSYFGSPRSVDGAPVRPHPSPKMKLRYLKSVFPKAEETVILDVLANKDNNVLKASEELLSMGFSKKETVVNTKPKVKTPNAPKKVVQIMKTAEEKETMKGKLQTKYKSIAPRVVSIALESVDFNEERAEQILSVVLQEDSAPKSAEKVETSKATVDQTTRPINRSLSGQLKSETQSVARPDCRIEVANKHLRESAPLRSNKRRLKNWTDQIKAAAAAGVAAGGAALLGGLGKSFQSPLLLPASGANPQLRQGPQDKLLLEDYVSWKGPNPELRASGFVKTDGPEPRAAIRSGARGADSTLAKGPANIAQGAIYQRHSKTSVNMCV